MEKCGPDARCRLEIEEHKTEVEKERAKESKKTEKKQYYIQTERVGTTTNL